MRVLLITSVYPRWEGDPSASFLVESVRHLRKANCAVTVLAPSYHGLTSHDADGVRVRRFRYFLKRWENLTHDEGAPTRVRNPFYRLIAAFYILAGLAATYRECRKVRYDIIHVQWPFPHGLFGLLGRKINKAKLICTFHGAELLLMRRFSYVRPLLKFVVRHSDAVTVNSTFTAKQVRALGEKDVEIIPYGWTVEVLPAACIAKTHSNGHKDILYVGRLIERKGLDFLISAIPQIISNVDARLTIVGEGDQLPRIRSLVELLNLQGRVEFTGIVSKAELQDRYQSCDVFVLPSIVDSRGDTEGLGVVLVEAMLFGKPVVATNVGGISDLVIDGTTGLLVPEKDTQALATAITRVCCEEGLADKLGAAGKAHVEEKFNWELLTQKLLRVYSGTANHGR